MDGDGDEAPHRTEAPVAIGIVRPLRLELSSWSSDLERGRPSQAELTQIGPSRLVQVDVSSAAGDVQIGPSAVDSDSDAEQRGGGEEGARSSLHPPDRGRHMSTDRVGSLPLPGVVTDPGRCAAWVSRTEESLSRGTRNMESALLVFPGPNIISNAVTL